MTERDNFLESIARTIQDYRKGTLPQPISAHVDRWVQQFDANVQIPILTEMDHVLKNTYFSKEKVSTFLRGLVKTVTLTGDSPNIFWQTVNFLDIQGGGNSQTEMLDHFSEVLNNEFGFGIDGCGQSGDVFLYLDDGVFTGNRIRRDLASWIQNDAPVQAKLHVVCIAWHSGGQYYAAGKIREAITAAGKNIDITWWRAVDLEDRRAYSYSADVLCPTDIPDDELVQKYVAGMKYKPSLRTIGNPGSKNLFSSDTAKILLEQEFLKSGARIRQMCPNLGETQRPLGHMTLETLGFGSLIVTYRNCPNNAPLALWVDEPWYPLFPRTTNSDSAIKRAFASLTTGGF